MKEDFNREDINTHNARQEEDPYARYQELGGIINRKDYESALRRLRFADTTLNKVAVKQGEFLAEFSGIELANKNGDIDPRIKLYAILRGDNKPERVQYHHVQMGDQRIFAEVLRMLGDTDALDKLIRANHKIGMYCPICSKSKIVAGEECQQPEE